MVNDRLGNSGNTTKLEAAQAALNSAIMNYSKNMVAHFGYMDFPASGSQCGISAISSRSVLLLTDHESNCTVGSSLNPCDDAIIQAGRLLNMESATTNVLAIGLSNDNPNLPFNGCLDQIGRAGGAPRTAADGSVATTAYYPIASTTSLNDTLKAIINPAACRFYIKVSSFDRDNMTITVDGNAIPSDRKNGWAFEDSASAPRPTSRSRARRAWISSTASGIPARKASASSLARSLQRIDVTEINLACRSRRHCATTSVFFGGGVPGWVLTTSSERETSGRLRKD
jgi:hypothetical protein